MPPSSRALLPALAVLGAVSLAPLPAANAAPKRPIVDDLRTFEYADLPLLETVPYAWCSGAPPRIALEHRSASSMVMSKPSPMTWRIEGLPTDSSLRIGNRHWVSRIGYGSTPKFGEPAEWVVLDRFATTADSAPISRCTASAKQDVALAAATVEKGFASALVPGRLYAYRRCVQGCDEPLGSDARVEELGVVTSPAIFIASSDWGANGTAAEDAFGRGFATVRPGTTATIVVGLAPADSSLGVLRSPKSASGADTFDVEVVWPAGGEPSMTLFTGHADGTARTLGIGR